MYFTSIKLTTYFVLYITYNHHYMKHNINQLLITVTELNNELNEFV